MIDFIVIVSFMLTICHFELNWVIKTGYSLRILLILCGNTLTAYLVYTQPYSDRVINNSMRAATGLLAPPRVTVGGPGDVILKGSKKIRNRWPVSTTPLSFGATTRGTAANSRICHIFLETTIIGHIGLHFDTDSTPYLTLPYLRGGCKAHQR